jgi:hypothetical protein
MRNSQRHTRVPAICFGIVMLGLGASPARGQDRPVNFFLNSPIDVQSGYESGIPNGNTRLNAPATIVTLPTFSLMHMSPLNDFTVYYQPEFEILTSLPSLNSFNQNAGLHWIASISPRWSFTANDVFTSTNDEGQSFQSTFLLPLGAYKDNGFYSSLNFDLTPNTRIKFRYETAFVDYTAVNLSKPLFFSRIGNTGGVTVDHHLTARMKLSVSYDYLRAMSLEKYDNNGNLILPFAPTQFATSTLTYNATPSLLMEVTGGFVHNPTNSYLVGGLVEKHFQHMTIAGGYSRYLTFVGGVTAASVDSAVDVSAAQLLPPNSISNTVSFRTQGYLTYHWGIDTTIMASDTSGTTNYTTLRSAMGGARLNYRISDHLTLFADAGLYRQNANVILPVAISRSRFFGGISYTFSPTPDQIARRKEAARSGMQAPSAPAPSVASATKEN